MGLMDAIRTAQGSLGLAGRASALVAGNVGRAGEPGHARRELHVTTDVTGARLARVRRAHDAALEGASLRATGTAAAADARADLVARMREMHGGPDAASGPHARLVGLRTAMQRLAAEPSSGVGAAAAIDAARDLAEGVNAIAGGIAAARTDADAALADAADELRGALDAFSRHNAEVVAAERQGRDSSDARDARAGALRTISGLVDVHVRERDGSDMVLLAGSPGGAVLHDTVPREVSFAASGTLTGTSPGGGLTVDGRALDAAAGGRIGGLLDGRDRIAPMLATDLDAFASALVECFSEAGAPGLFVAGVSGAGAGGIAVNAAFDPREGGDPTLLRDGLGRASNPTGAPGYADLLIERIEGLDTPMASLDGASALSRAADHLAGLEATRSGALAAADAARAGTERAERARADALGVNVDEEMAGLMEIERSYAASARVIAVADAMLEDLLRLAGR